MNNEQKGFDTLYNLWNILTIARRKKYLENKIKYYKDELMTAKDTDHINIITNELSMRLKNLIELEKYHKESIGMINEIKELLK